MQAKQACAGTELPCSRVNASEASDKDLPGLAGALVQILKEKGWTVATAESCTGGLVAAQLTGVPGASSVFGYGYVTYWEQAKTKMIGVAPEVIARCNVVSGQVAAQMALGAKNASGATLAVGITGIAGPDGGDAARPVGTVYIGTAMGGSVWVQRLALAPAAGRQGIRLGAAYAALDMLRCAALCLAVPGVCLTQEQARRADWIQPAQ